MRVTAGYHKAYEGRLQVFVLDKVGADMSLDMVDSDKWFVLGKSDGFGGGYSNEKGAYKTGAVGHGNCIDIIKGNPSF